MTDRQRLWGQLIRPYLQKAHNLTSTLHLAVISSTLGKTEPRGDYERQSIESRFYTTGETDYLLAALRRGGFLVNAFFREEDFIRWIDKGQHLQASPRRLMVISTGASFPGIGSKSLIPAFCRLHGIDVAGPDPHTASLARHKYHATLILQTLGDVVPTTWCYDPRRGWLLNQSPRRGQRVILKLIHEGASIGVDESSVVTVDASLSKRVAKAAHDFSQPIIVQEFIAGYEVEIPLFCTPRPQALMPVGISLQSRRYLDDLYLTYDSTQAERYGFWDFEKEGPAEATPQLLRLATRCAEILGVRDLGRIDLRISRSGRPVVIDVSTSPYLSPHSSFAFVSKTCGADPAELPLILVGLAAARLGLDAESARQQDGPSNL